MTALRILHGITASLLGMLLALGTTFGMSGIYLGLNSDKFPQYIAYVGAASAAMCIVTLFVALKGIRVREVFAANRWFMVAFYVIVLFRVGGSMITQLPQAL